MNNKYILGAVLLVVIVFLAFVFAGKNSNDGLIGDTVLVTTFTSYNEPSGTVLLQIPFLKDLKTNDIISIAVDQNADNQFSTDETLIENYPVVGFAEWRSGYYATSGIPLQNGLNAQITIGEMKYKAILEVQTVETEDLLDLASVTDPENATKGLGVAVAHAEEPVEITFDRVPDLNQRKGECAPTAAANSLISLVDRNGGEELISGDPQDFIENLKRHMNWTPENGVLPDDFVDGKNQWAAAAGVPIRTKKVGDGHGLTTIDEISTALQNGDAVELRIKFADAAGTKIVGGHMVTVVGIHQSGSQTYLEINDPYTKDSGTEMVEIRQNTISNYGPYTEGSTILSWGFVQTWEGHPTGELFDTMTDEEIRGLQQFVGDDPKLTVIKYGDKYLPASQLMVESEVGCGANHWHAITGVVTATDGTQVPDPGPQCGYGKVSENPSMEISMPNNND